MFGYNTVIILRQNWLIVKKVLFNWRKAINHQEKSVKWTYTQQLSNLQSCNVGDQIDLHQHLQEQFQQQLDEEDLKWKPRAKQHWLKHGDNNIRFFHLHANQRRKANLISKLLNHDEEEVTGQDQLGMFISSFYNQLFATSNPYNINLYLRYLQPMVNEAMNSLLLADIIDNEVQNAIFQINAFRAPRPDVFLHIFSKKLDCIWKGCVLFC